MRKYGGICCICMQKCLFVENIVNDQQEITYLEKLKACIPNEIWYDDFNICKSCIEKLEAAYEFVQICLNSEEFRKEKLRLIESDNVEKSGTSPAPNKRQLFVCNHCKRSFNLKRFLKQHITRKHSIVKKGRKSKKVTNTEVKAEVKDEAIPGDDAEDKNIFAEDFIEVNITEDATLKIEDKELKEEETFKETTEEDAEGGLKKQADNDGTSDLEDDYQVNDENYYTESENEEQEDVKTKIKTAARKRGPKFREPLKCQYCDLIFNKKQLWASHIRSKHTFEKPFACDICDARYMNSYSLLIHKRKHNNEKPFICATCGKSFVSSADLNHHQKIHNLTRDYPCSECDKSFKTHSNLRTHRLQMHLDPADWKFFCTVCNKKFPIRSNLVKHLKRHAGIKDFPCHICDKKFINKAELMLHMNSHTNERLFKCKLCQKEYKNREGLRRHMKVVHDMGNWKAPKLEKKFLCPMCPKIFAFTAKLQRHIFTHTGEKPYKCDYCSKRFIDNYGRKVHVKKDHSIEFF